MRIDFRAAPTHEQLNHLTDLLQNIPGQGRVSDLLELYGAEQVVFTFKSTPEPQLAGEVAEIPLSV